MKKSNIWAFSQKKCLKLLYVVEILQTKDHWVLYSRHDMWFANLMTNVQHETPIKLNKSIKYNVWENLLSAEEIETTRMAKWRMSYQSLDSNVKLNCKKTSKEAGLQKQRNLVFQRTAQIERLIFLSIDIWHKKQHLIKSFFSLRALHFENKEQFGISAVCPLITKALISFTDKVRKIVSQLKSCWCS